MKKKKCLIVILVAMFLVVAFSGRVLASGDENVESLISGMGNINQVETGDGMGSRIRYVLNAVIKLIQIVGSGIAIIMVIMLGMKYMLASPGEKADYKKIAVPILIGCVLLFAASNIAGIIADVGMELN